MINGLAEGRDDELNRNCLKVERNPVKICEIEEKNVK